MLNLRADKKRTAHVFNSKWRSADVILNQKADFSSLLLSERVLKGLKKAGFKKPSPIQLEAIPFGRYGKDLFIQAKSGTGKTLVFTVVALEMLQDIRCPQVLVLAPTREIADQIREVITSIGSGFKTLTCCSFIGGIPVHEDRTKVYSCQIAVGTPGRVKQLISDGVLPTYAIRLFVLDEADVLLRDKSFVPTINDIFKLLPKEKQVIATSATYPSSIKKLINNYFRDPYIARLEKENISLLGTIHYQQEVQHSSSVGLAYKFKLKALENILERVKFSQCLVFCNRVTMVECLCKDIKKLGFTVTFISSAKEQADRLKAIDALKRFKCKILICTDLTSRGIDAENVDLIINFDCPTNIETYLHRVGRAGRYGSRGVAITFRTKTENIVFAGFQKNANFKAHYLPNPLIRDLIKFIPNKVDDSNTDSEALDEEPDIINRSVGNARAEITLSKIDAESIVHKVSETKGNLQNSDIQNEIDDKVEKNLHNESEFVMKRLSLDFDKILISGNADNAKDEKEKKRDDLVKNEAEGNVNFKIEVLLNDNTNVDLNFTEDIEKELDFGKINDCDRAEPKKALYTSKIALKNEKKFNHCKIESNKNQLQGTLNNLQMSKSFPETYKQAQLKSPQTCNDKETSNEREEKEKIPKETSNEEENSSLNKTSNKNDQAKKNGFNDNVINSSISKFITNYVEGKSDHLVLLNEEEIKENSECISHMPFRVKKCVTRKDISILKSRNNSFFYNVLVDHFNNKSKEKSSCIMGTDEKDSIKDHSERSIYQNLSNKEKDICQESDISSSNLTPKPLLPSNKFDQSGITSVDQVVLENFSDNMHILRSTPDIKNTTSHNKNSDSFKTSSRKSNVSSKADDFEDELKWKVVYHAPDVDNLITNYCESSDAESDEKIREYKSNENPELNCGDIAICSFDESKECSFKSKELSCDVNEECSYTDSEEDDGESETSSEESEESSDAETEESSDVETEESSDVETVESSDKSSEESSSITGSSFTGESDSDTKQSSELERVSNTSNTSNTSSKSSYIHLQNKKHRKLKNRDIMKVKRERLTVADSRSKKDLSNNNFCCSSCSCCSSLPCSIFKNETQKTVSCPMKTNVIPKHRRKNGKDRKGNLKTKLMNPSQMPFYASNTSNCPHTCYRCENIKYFNYGYSSNLNSEQYCHQCCGTSSRHFQNTALSHINEDYYKQCNLWYQIFYRQYFWIQHTAFNISKNF